MDEANYQENLKIVQIYKTNNFQDGVGFQASRFTHSCCPNALLITNNQGSCDIEAQFSIKAGEEITLNYAFKDVTMKSFKTRQKILLSNWGFHCCCHICKEGEDEKYHMFEELQKEAQKLDMLKNLRSRTKSDQEIEKIRREVFCYKEMYKLAKEKNAGKLFILIYILEGGFNVALHGFLTTPTRSNFKNLLEFKNDCDNFSKVGEIIAQKFEKSSNRRFDKVWPERRNLETYAIKITRLANSGQLKEEDFLGEQLSKIHI